MVMNVPNIHVKFLGFWRFAKFQSTNKGLCENGYKCMDLSTDSVMA